MLLFPGVETSQVTPGTLCSPSPLTQSEKSPWARRFQKDKSFEPGALVQGHSLIFPWSGLGVVTVWPDALVSATQ